MQEYCFTSCIDVLSCSHPIFTLLHTTWISSKHDLKSMQVHRKTHASAIPTPCKCIQTVIQAKPSSFKSSKMTISQKIKSDLIPFFSDLIPFFPGKSTQRKEKEKKEKQRKSLSLRSKREIRVGTLSSWKKQNKRKDWKQLHSGLYFTIFANCE